MEYCKPPGLSRIIHDTGVSYKLSACPAGVLVTVRRINVDKKLTDTKVGSQRQIYVGEIHHKVLIVLPEFSHSFSTIRSKVRVFVSPLCMSISLKRTVELRLAR